MPTWKANQSALMMIRLLVSFVFPIVARSQTAPKIGINEVYRTRLTVSWTIPKGATSIEVEKATNRSFSPSSQIYKGISSQISGQTGLAQNTWYYFRVRANYKSTRSVWTIDSVKTFWTPFAANLGGNRIATALDLSLHPFINIGDYLIVGSDSGLYKDTTWKIAIGSGNYGGVGGSVSTGLKIPPLKYYKNKIVILGGTGYDYISLNLDNVAGIRDSLRIITVIGGQTKAKLYLNNMRYCKVTGKYDPVAKTGDPLFKGFDNSNWSKLEGSFAFFTQGRYDQSNILLSHIHGNSANSLIEYVESGEGGFSGMTIKNDEALVPMKNITIRKCYTHDTGGEGYYIGSTQSNPQMPVVEFELYDNVVTRAGLNSFQIGQMKGPSNIHNNVFMSGGFRWNSSFNKNQDQAIQLHTRENGAIFQNNLICGSAGEFITWFMLPNPAIDHPKIEQTTYLSHNLFIDTRSFDGGYITARQGFKGTINFDSNYFAGIGKSNLAYRAIFNSDSNYKNQRLISLANFDSSHTVWKAYENFLDNSVPSDLLLAAGNGRIENNRKDVNKKNLRTLARPHFVNYMDLELNAIYDDMEQWVGLQCPAWNAANRTGTAFALLKQKNFSSSNTIITIPTEHPATVKAIVGTEKRYVIGERLDFTNGSNTFMGTIVAYDPVTGSVILKSVSNKGAGTFSSWNVTLDIESIAIYRTYKAGDIVRFDGRFYKSLRDNNTNHTPGANKEFWWKLIIFSNGRIYPPDDVRLKFDDFYAKQKIGLSSVQKIN